MLQPKLLLSIHFSNKNLPANRNGELLLFMDSNIIGFCVVDDWMLLMYGSHRNK